MPASKLCNKCGLTKPVSEFHKQLGGYQPSCKVCRSGKAAPKPAAVKPAKPASNVRVGLLDAAALVLATATEPMGVKALADAAIAGGWHGRGKTPSQTLSAQIQRELKSNESRFKRAGRGLFTGASK